MNKYNQILGRELHYNSREYKNRKRAYSMDWVDCLELVLHGLVFLGFVWGFIAILSVLPK